MGYYIDRFEAELLPTKGKADFLVSKGAKKIEIPERFTNDLVCVIDEGIYDAAGFAFNENEMKRFLNDGYGRSEWLKVPNADFHSKYTK